MRASLVKWLVFIKILTTISLITLCFLKVWTLIETTDTMQVLNKIYYKNTLIFKHFIVEMSHKVI